MPARRTDKTDPRLSTKAWRHIRATWTHLQPTTCQATPCLLPGTPITYTTPRTRTSLDIGHKTPRALDNRRTWTIDDTRPEHSYCNQSAGQTVKRLLNTKKPINKREQAKSANKW